MNWTVTNTLTIIGIVVSPIISTIIAVAFASIRSRIDLAKFMTATDLKIEAIRQATSDHKTSVDKELATMRRDADEQEMLLRKIDSNISAIRSDDFGEFRERLAKVETLVQMRRTADKS